MPNTFSTIEDIAIGVPSTKPNRDQSQCANKGHVNEGFEDEAGCRRKISVRLESLENVDDDDDYHTLEEVEERREDQMEEENIVPSECWINAGQSESHALEDSANHRLSSIYDNYVDV
jgi:excinuclease UvrABC nuclease subunit